MPAFAPWIKTEETRLIIVTRCTVGAHAVYVRSDDGWTASTREIARVECQNPTDAVDIHHRHQR
jgi:hypothetical protein